MYLKPVTINLVTKPGFNNSGRYCSPPDTCMTVQCACHCKSFSESFEQQSRTNISVTLTVLICFLRMYKKKLHILEVTPRKVRTPSRHCRVFSMSTITPESVGRVLHNNTTASTIHTPVETRSCQTFTTSHAGASRALVKNKRLGGSKSAEIKKCASKISHGKGVRLERGSCVCPSL